MFVLTEDTNEAAPATCPPDLASMGDGGSYTVERLGAGAVLVLLLLVASQVEAAGATRPRREPTRHREA